MGLMPRDALLLRTNEGTSVGGSLRKAYASDSGGPAIRRERVTVRQQKEEGLGAGEGEEGMVSPIIITEGCL